MPSTLCHACGAPVKSGSENSHGDVYCSACRYDMFHKCEQCSELILNTELNYCGGSAVCKTCTADLGFQRCEHCECCERSSDIIDTGSDGGLCALCASALGYCVCDNCKVLIKEGDGRQEWSTQRQYDSDSVTSIYCDTCTNELLAQCEDCGQWNLSTNMQNSDGGTHCTQCDSMPNFDRADEIAGESFDEIRTELYFGVEIETHRCQHYMDFKNEEYWGAKGDPTIRGKEFDSVKMNGDEGLAAIRRICAFADDHSWQVNNSCGLHLHIDMTGFNSRQLRAIAYAYTRTATIWQSFVNDSRANNGWCEFESLSEGCIQRLTTKRQWMNMAYDTEHYRWHSCA